MNGRRDGGGAAASGRMALRVGMSSMAFRLVLTGVFLGAAGGVRADAFRTPALHPGPPVSVQGYGGQNPACSRWTDGCVLCARDPAGTVACSTPGIACEPRGITCKSFHPR